MVVERVGRYDKKRRLSYINVMNGLILKEKYDIK